MPARRRRQPSRRKHAAVALARYRPIFTWAAQCTGHGLDNQFGLAHRAVTKRPSRCTTAGPAATTCRPPRRVLVPSAASQAGSQGRGSRAHVRPLGRSSGQRPAARRGTCGLGTGAEGGASLTSSRSRRATGTPPLPPSLAVVFHNYSSRRRATERVGMKAGTGKSRPDRRRIPYKPIGYHISRKNRKREKIRENLIVAGTETVVVFSRPFSRFPY